MRVQHGTFMLLLLSVSHHVCSRALARHVALSYCFDNQQIELCTPIQSSSATVAWHCAAAGSIYTMQRIP